MEPIHQTLLTLGCMFGAYLWGKAVGWRRASTEILTATVIGLNVLEIDVNIDANRVTLMDIEGDEIDGAEAMQAYLSKKHS